MYPNQAYRYVCICVITLTAYEFNTLGHNWYMLCVRFLQLCWSKGRPAPDRHLDHPLNPAHTTPANEPSHDPAIPSAMPADQGHNRIRRCIPPGLQLLTGPVTEYTMASSTFIKALQPSSGQAKSLEACLESVLLHIGTTKWPGVARFAQAFRIMGPIRMAGGRMCLYAALVRCQCFDAFEHVGVLLPAQLYST